VDAFDSPSNVGGQSSSLTDQELIYVREGFPDVKIVLHSSGAVINGPGFNEQRWRAAGNRIELLSRDGVPRVEMTLQSDGGYAGQFVNSGSATPTRLRRCVTGELANSITIRLGARTIRWTFQFAHDFRFLTKTIRLTSREQIAANQSRDVSVYHRLMVANPSG
jgi:hypothetical protein